MGRDDRGADRRAGIAFLALCVAAFVIVIYVLHASIGENALTLPFENTRVVQALAPEGWAFFTKSPLTPEVVAYRPNSTNPTQWEPASPGALAVPADLFGLDRSRRAFSAETAVVLQNNPPQDWSSCTTDPLQCLSSESTTLQLKNPLSSSGLCGRVGFVQQDVLPWAWRNTNTVMPSKVVVAEIEC